MSGFFQVFYAIFSGILTSLAIPNEIFYFGSPFFGMIALVPLYMAAREAKSYKQAALLFGIDALTTHLLSSFWLANFKDFAIFTLGASAIGTFCIEAMAGCAFFAPFALTRRVQGSVRRVQNIWYTESLTPYPLPLFTVPWFACVRVVYEWAKSTGFLAYPWGTLSMSAFRAKTLVQSADIFGVYGITFLFAFIAGTLGEALRAGYSRKGTGYSDSLTPSHLQLIKCSIALLCCFSLYGAYQLCAPRLQTKTLNAVLVQQNRDPWADNGDNETMKISIALSEKGVNEFAEQGIKPDIIVWSEAVLRSTFPYAYTFYEFRPQGEPLLHFIRRMKTPFLIGGAYSINEEKQQVANAALIFDKESLFRGYYGKTHLVPFAEAVPGTEYEIVRKAMDKIVGFSNGWTPGQEFTLFDIDVSSEEKKPFPSFKIIDMKNNPEIASKTKVRIATPICFEDAFPDICGPFHNAGAEIFLNITDDSWSKTASAEYQHFVVATFRAIEYRTTLARSTNAGFTTVIDPCGRILQSIPLFEENYLCARIPIYQKQQTVYSRFTNWFVHLILIFMLAIYCAIAQVNIALRMNVLRCRAKVNVLRSECCRARQEKSLRECIEAALSEIEF